MHATVQNFVERTLYVRHVFEKRVLEVGSFDVNGSVRPFVESLRPAWYLGVDQTPGPGVDQVVNCEQLTREVGCAVWDLVISTEMLEHVEDWRRCLWELAAAVVPGGYLLVTTRSPGFPYHAFPVDNHRFTHQQMHCILAALKLETLALEDDPEPGVLVFARKPLSDPYVAPDALKFLDAESVVRQ
jgi:SAM-dependent methyltransferase